MKTNKKAQLSLLGIMLSIMFMITVIVLIEPIKDQVEIARAPASLDCTNTSISVSTQIACIVTDTMIFGWVGIGLTVALGLIAHNRLTQ